MYLKRRSEILCRLERVEVTGRDISAVCEHAAAVNSSVRALVGTQSEQADRILRTPEGSMVRFDLLPQKVFLFDRETEKRIFFEEK